MKMMLNWRWVRIYFSLNDEITMDKFCAFLVELIITARGSDGSTVFSIMAKIFPVVAAT